MTRAVAAAGATLALGLGLAGCSSAAPADAVEEQIVAQLGAETADCPDGLDSTVGATITCSATAGGETFDVTATVTSVAGDTINFDLERVGAPAAQPTQPTQPTPEPADQPTMDGSTGVVDGQEVAQAVFDQLTATVGQEPDEVSCPDLPAEVGATIRCDLVAGADTLGVTVTATSVEGGTVGFDIAVDETGGG